MRNRNDWAIINELIDDGCEVLSADGTTLDDVNGRFMGDIQAAVVTLLISHKKPKKAYTGDLNKATILFTHHSDILTTVQERQKVLTQLKHHLSSNFSIYILKRDSL